MSINPDAITEAIKRAGAHNVRTQPTDGGKVQIEVNEGGGWKAISPPLSEGMANDLVNRGKRGVILG